MVNKPLTAKVIWEALRLKRESYLDRAREVSSLTLPFMYPPDGHSSDSDLPTPYQGVGARGVNNLASKLLITLLPPGSLFFRLLVDESAIRRLVEDEAQAGQISNDIRAEVAQRETEIQSELESRGVRVRAFEALRHMIVSGNCLLWYPKGDRPLRVFGLNDYVLDRDGDDNIVKMAIKQSVSLANLPENVRQVLLNSVNFDPNKKEYELYWGIVKTAEGYKIWQEVEEVILPGTLKVTKDLPFLALRMNQVSGEPYGRGIGEEYLGDMTSLESLMRSIVLGAGLSAHTIYLVRSQGFTRIQDLQRAETGAFITGNVEDVQALQTGKNGDFSMALQTVQLLERRLEQAFLLATPRQAERVTAEEIRTLIRELEDALGGVYSLLTEEFQLPLVELTEKRMEEDGRLQPVPKGIVKPKVITGIEGLGRGQDAQRLAGFSQSVQGSLGPQEFARRVNGAEFVARMAAAFGVDPDGLIKSDEQLQQEAQQAAAQQAAQNAAPEIVRQVGQQAQGQQ